ncbi:MAG: peroxiredoxin [Planctomycetes bacterium]|nr:peroxiredoxin [Planctomycetota bacterium]
MAKAASPRRRVPVPAPVLAKTAKATSAKAKTAKAELAETRPALGRIPRFALAGTDGRTWTAADLAGRTWVLYFYPKDNTPGCTRQACGFRDAFARLEAKGVVVFGVSPDSLKSHGGFIAKQRLPFVLLSDPAHELAERLGVWTRKSLYGRSFMGIERTTLLIGSDGAILRIWRKVKVDGHVDEVLAAAGV